MMTAMRRLVRISIGIVMALNLSIIGSLGLTASCQAEDTEPEIELVPEPRIRETHEYDVPGEIDGTPTDEYFVNEQWSIEVRHGDVMTLIMARNMTQEGIAAVDYQNNIHYSIGGKLYIAQFMIFELAFRIGGYEIHSPLSTCSDFALSYSPILYDGTVPTFDCNITYEGIRVYSVGSIPVGAEVSTVDLTLVHHIRGDWNNTHIKIEALLDFGNTIFFDLGDSNNEFNAGEPFTAEIGYIMALGNPEDSRTEGGPLIPSGYTNTTLEYNMTLDDGSPLTVSRLDMRNSFTIYNGSGACDSTGYSYMELYGGQAYVTHGFPNLTYKDTQSMRTDPEITIYHDWVTETEKPLWILIPVVVSIATVGIAILLVKRRTRGSV
jgi:hypothetical protein